MPGSLLQCVHDVLTGSHVMRPQYTAIGVKNC
jgi:hypothetical protein